MWVRVGPPILAASRLFQPALVAFPQGRLERAAAGRIAGPTRTLYNQICDYVAADFGEAFFATQVHVA
jgi:hypothetical protein